MKIKKNDTVKITVGKEKNKTGKISKVFSDSNRILVEGINMYRKHVRPKRQGEKGETVMVPRSLNASNVLLVCPNCKNPVKVGHSVSDGVKKRICKKCKSII